MARHVAHVIATLLGMLLATIASASAEVRLEVDHKTIQAFDVEDGAELWSFRGFSEDEDATIVGAREHDGHVIYALSHTLYTVATRTGHITKRKLYPAPIVAIHETDDALKLELAVTTRRDSDALRVTIDYHPDAVYRAPWEVTAASPWQYEVGPRWLLHYRDIDFETRKKFEQWLRDDWDDDLTNPFYPLALAILAELNEEHELSAELAKHALALEAPWIVRLHVAELCELYFDRELADAAWRGVDEAMASAFVPRDSLNMRGTVRLMQTSVFVIKEAVEAGDVELVDRIVTRMRTQFPSPLLWGRALHALAVWCEQQGRPDLATKWHAAESDGLARDGEYQRLQMIHRTDFVVHLLALTLFVSALVFGLRRMRPARRWRLAAGAFRALTVVALLVLLAFAGRSQRGAQTAPRQADWVVLPAALGGYGSPQVMAAFPRDAAVQAAGERDRALWGTDRAEALPTSDELFGPPKRAGHGFERLFGRWVSPRVLIAWLVFKVLVACVVLTLLGRALRASSPRTADVLLALIPGGCAGVFGPLLALAFLFFLGLWAGAYTVTSYPLDTLTALTGWSDTKFQPHNTAVSDFALRAVGVLVLVHLALAARAIRGWRRIPDGSA